MSGLPVPTGTPQRLVYLGTPDASVPPLDALVAAGFDVALVVTRADARRGRRAEPTPSPVSAAAARLGIAVSHRAADATDVGADMGVVVAFGQIIRPDVLARLPMVNVHFSLLPRWRGAAPVERAILAGDVRTGVCLMHVEEGLDTGGTYACVEEPIEPADTAAGLRARLVRLGSDLLVDELRRGLGAPRPQVGDVTYADKVLPADRQLDFTNPADVEHRRVRIGDAHTTFRGRRMKVLAAEPVGPAEAGGPPGELRGAVVCCAEGGLRLVTVQPEGRGPMAWRDFANGQHPRDGECWGA